ncbi:MAG: sugar ABC transporter permease [Phycisphaerales bacterium]|jgi:multiple sugar transport system permease protein|nr:sugar ABC transporter permease [Phycisphaerales bacterium]
MRHHHRLTPLLYLLPNLTGFAIFVLIPVAAALVLSFFRWDLFHPPKFVGLDNFIDLLGWRRDAEGVIHLNDAGFWKYLYNTLYLMLAIPITMFCSLVLAVLLNQKLPGRMFFRSVFFLPNICAGVGLLLLWKFLYNNDFGLINHMLAWVGITGPDWLNSYNWSKPALMIIMIWGSMGGTGMILYLAGLQGIPPELYEAAEIDGANVLHRFRHITIPMLAPTTFFIFITAVIGGFQGGFDMAYILTKGGPDGATTTLSYYIYNHAFEYFNMGYAAALSLVLFALVLFVTMLSWRFGRGATE